MYNEDERCVCKMQVNAISPQNSGSVQNFRGRRDNIDAFINLDDGAIQQAAYLQTVSHIDTEKHRKIDKALNYALPVAGGLSSAAYAAKGARLSAFAGGALGWGLFLAGMGTVFGIEKYAKNRNSKVRDFIENHPILTFAGSVVAAYAAGRYAIKGGGKLIDLLAKTKAYNKVASSLNNAATAFKNNKHVVNFSQKVAKFAGKIPSALKSTAKVAASWSPMVLIFGSLFHSLNHRNVVNREFAHNYNNLKEKQLNLARKRNLELAVQNDFMLTDPKNREDLELLKGPKKGLNV